MGIQDEKREVRKGEWGGYGNRRTGLWFWDVYNRSIPSWRRQRRTGMARFYRSGKGSRHRAEDVGPLGFYPGKFILDGHGRRFRAILAAGGGRRVKRYRAPPRSRGVRLAKQKIEQ